MPNQGRKPRSDCYCLSAERAVSGGEVADTGFSNELARFVLVEVPSVEQLEILLLLSGNPHRWWSAAAVYEVIKSNPASVRERLQEFADKQILKKDDSGCYQFSPENQTVWKLVSELREAYKERPVKVVEAIYSRRADPVREFAKAFRFKKEQNG